MAIQIAPKVAVAPAREPKSNEPAKGSGKKSGRPAQGKQLISLRLDRAVIEKFRATGPGWQTRINEALRSHPIL